jgi:hypothetical protein
MSSYILPLAHLPVFAQLLIARQDNTQRRRVLAASPTTDHTVIDQLTNDSDRDVEHAALRFSQSPDLLTERFENSSDCCKASIARNLNTPQKILTLAAESTDARTRLSAYVNPSTPVEIRNTLDLQTAVDLAEIGSFLGARVVRTHELVHHNRHLIDEPENLTAMFRRAAFAQWDITVEQHTALRSKGRSTFAKRHPVVLSKGGAPSMTVDELVAANSPAADLYLTELPDLSAANAQTMLMRREYHTDPHIIGRLLRKFGLDAIPSQSFNMTLAQTRLTSGAWADPLVSHYNMLLIHRFAGMTADVSTAVAELGDDHGAWNTFLRLQDEWDGTLFELAQAARAL